MATFWEIAAHSVDHMFFLYFDYLYFSILVISRFGFEGCIWVLIASVPYLFDFGSMTVKGQQTVKGQHNAFDIFCNNNGCILSGPLDLVVLNSCKSFSARLIYTNFFCSQGSIKDQGSHSPMIGIWISSHV